MVPPRPRKDLPKAIKEQLWISYFGPSKAEGECWVCSKTIRITDFEAGHNIPVAKGGTDFIDNLRPVCGSCNKSMGTTSMDDYKAKYFGSSEREASADATVTEQAGTKTGTEPISAIRPRPELFVTLGDVAFAAFGTQGYPQSANMRVEVRWNALIDMTIESVQVNLSGEYLPAIKWLSSGASYAAQYVYFTIPESVGPGKHTVELEAFANKEWWSSGPKQFDFPRLAGDFDLDAASTNVVGGTATEETHHRSSQSELEEGEIATLKLLAKFGKQTDAVSVADGLEVHPQRALYHLDNLKEKEYVTYSVAGYDGQPPGYSLTQKGREYLFKNGII